MTAMSFVVPVVCAVVSWMLVTRLLHSVSPGLGWKGVRVLLLCLVTVTLLGVIVQSAILGTNGQQQGLQGSVSSPVPGTSQVVYTEYGKVKQFWTFVVVMPAVLASILMSGAAAAVAFCRERQWTQAVVVGVVALAFGSALCVYDLLLYFTAKAAFI